MCPLAFSLNPSIIPPLWLRPPPSWRLVGPCSNICGFFRSSTHQQSRHQVQQLQQQLNWMHQQAPLLRQLKQAAPINAAADIDIASALTASSQTQQLALKRIQPQGENALVELDIVGFDQLVNWLDLLEQQYGITPQQIELQSLPTLVGKVQVKRLLLGRNNKE
jgi:general secretion pathway protein M